MRIARVERTAACFRLTAGTPDAAHQAGRRRAASWSHGGQITTTAELQGHVSGHQIGEAAERSHLQKSQLVVGQARRVVLADRRKRILA